MDSQAVASYCRGLNAAHEDYPFGPGTLVFKVGGKIFAIMGEQSVSLKCDPHVALALRENYPAVTPGYHLNKRHWNTVALDGSVPDDELRDWLLDSHALAVASLTRAERAALTAG
jgi:predicted DNA-binding protein (MmcQ/YjbR family)